MTVAAMAAGVGCGAAPATATSPSVVAATPPVEPPAPPTPPPAPWDSFPPVQRVVWGRVLDFDTVAPVIGARVSLHELLAAEQREVLAVTTSGDGRFNLTGATRGGFTVRLQRAGYEPAEYCCYFDFTGDLALEMYRTVILRPGQVLELSAFLRGADSYRCGPEGWWWCRRVVVESADGGPVLVEASTADGEKLPLADHAYFEHWNPGTTVVVPPGAVWLLERLGMQTAPAMRVRLSARHP